MQIKNANKLKLFSLRLCSLLGFSAYLKALQPEELFSMSFA
jgi:hypothetical protein